MSSKTGSHKGWLEEHPEDQRIVDFSIPGVSKVIPLFKELSQEEEQEFRQHARETYVLGSEINEVYHPVWQDEARKMNEERDETS